MTTVTIDTDLLSRLALYAEWTAQDTARLVRAYPDEPAHAGAYGRQRDVALAAYALLRLAPLGPLPAIDEIRADAQRAAATVFEQGGGMAA